MKRISEAEAIERLGKLKSSYAARIRDEFEHRAKPCSLCETPGACCVDAHFVNVHITWIEAAAIRKRLNELPSAQRQVIKERIDRVIEIYGLSDAAKTSSLTYACPLFENGIGCLVHGTAKPLPCISHACYERKEDLPPDALQSEQEKLVEMLNTRTYGARTQWFPLPIAIKERKTFNYKL